MGFGAEFPRKIMTVEEKRRPSPEALLARLDDQDRARLRIYIGAAPGVGKTFTMLEEAHVLKRSGLDVVIGFVETYGRPPNCNRMRPSAPRAHRELARAPRPLIEGL